MLCRLPVGLILIQQFKMKKIAVICNSDNLAIPAINYLFTNGYLAGVGVLGKYRNFLLPKLNGIGIAESLVDSFDKENWIQAKTDWLKRIEADTVWVFGFPWKIPATLLAIPEKGFFNFHFGLFPMYRGADPIFWQIKNKEEKAGFVIHKMTGEVDAGPVVWEEYLPIVPGENYGLYSQRAGMVAASVLDSFLQQTESGLPERNEGKGDSPYFKRPDVTQRTISWQTQSAEEIEWLVNACNPKYGGASTRLRGTEIALLEVAPADVGDSPAVEPGTVIYSDALYGIIVACRDQQYLRINVLSMNEGYISGSKLFSLGVKAGEKFHD